MKDLGAPVAENDLHAFIDGQMTPANRAAVINYLAIHPEQTARVLGWRRQNDAIRAAFAGPLPLAGPDGARAANVVTLPVGAGGREDAYANLPPIHAAPGSRMEPRKAGGARPLGLRLKNGSGALGLVAFGLFAGAVTLTIGAGGLSGVPFLRTEPRVAAASESMPAQSLAARTFEAHRLLTLEPSRTPGPEKGLSPRLQAWLASPASLSLRAGAERYDFTGARALPGDGREGLLLVYQNNLAQRVTLALSRAAGQNPQAFRTQAEGTLMLVSWADQDSAFALTGALDRERLLALARAAYANIEAAARK